MYIVPSFCSAIVAPMNNSISAFSSIFGQKSSSMISCVGLDVDRIPFRCLFMCPFAVAVDAGKYFLTSFDVMCGKPMS